MTARISLTELRERATFENTIPAAEGHIEIPITTILALIDTAETANDVDLEYHALAAEGEGLHTEAQRIRRLSRSLDRYEQ